MSLAELVITTVKVEEGRTKSEVARDYRMSRYWVHLLVKRFESEGEAAFTPRSRRPHTSPQAVGVELEDRIVRLRKELTKKGWDAGAETIRAHLLRDPTLDRVPSTSTIWRHRRGRGGSWRWRRRRSAARRGAGAHAGEQRAGGSAAGGEPRWPARRPDRCRGAGRSQTKVGKIYKVALRAEVAGDPPTSVHWPRAPDHHLAGGVV
jgi:hypothetical protein